MSETTNSFPQVDAFSLSHVAREDWHHILWLKLCEAQGNIVQMALIKKALDEVFEISKKAGYDECQRQQLKSVGPLYAETIKKEGK